MAPWLASSKHGKGLWPNLQWQAFEEQCERLVQVQILRADHQPATTHRDRINQNPRTNGRTPNARDPWRQAELTAPRLDSVCLLSPAYILPSALVELSRSASNDSRSPSVSNLSCCTESVSGEEGGDAAVAVEAEEPVDEDDEEESVVGCTVAGAEAGAAGATVLTAMEDDEEAKEEEEE